MRTLRAPLAGACREADDLPEMPLTILEQATPKETLMKILNISAAVPLTPDQNLAVREFLEGIRNGRVPGSVIERLPPGSVEVIVASEGDANNRAIFTIGAQRVEAPEVWFAPLPRPS
jgi:hypothetical protein